MLGECLEIFGSFTREEREHRILDHYIPKNGTYILIGRNGEVLSATDFILDKKTGEINRNAVEYRKFCYYDYYSNLISMNKSLDPSKIIHSNNYLAFWVKKESILSGKLTLEIIDKYYSILEYPEKKYEVSVYEKLEKEIGRVDTEVLYRNKKWITEHIFDMNNLELNIDMKKMIT